jgi:Flp pilus assembly protein protease CpaA
MVIIPADIRYFKIPALPILLIILAGLISSSADKLPGQMAASVAIFIILFCFGAIGWVLPSRKFGFGMGDLKLAAALSWMYGITPSIYILIISIYVGGMIGLIYSFSNISAENKLPFGSIMVTVMLYYLLFPQLERKFWSYLISQFSMI